MKSLAQIDSDRAAKSILPWTGGLRLTTLWDMKEYLAPRLTEITRQFVNIHAAFACRDEDQDESDRAAVSKYRPQLSSWVQRILLESELLGLRSTTLQASRIIKSGAVWNSRRISDEVAELERRFDEETEDLKLFYVPLDRIVFYNRTDLFGDEFKAKFPIANAEVSEAGNCFAFDRFTACAFHLMRALEVVLKALFSALGLPPITSTGAQNWNGILRQIKDKLEANKTMTDYDFYDSAYAFLSAAKNPMRNATMHVDAVYDESSVRSLYDAVGAFMRHVATKLKE